MITQIWRLKQVRKNGPVLFKSDFENCYKTLNIYFDKQKII